MPGKKPRRLKPSEFLVIAEPQITAAGGEAAGRRKIEAFPWIDGSAPPKWVDLPRRRTVKDVVTLALPEGAHPVPLYDPTGPAEIRPVRSSAAAQARFLMVGEGYPDNGGEQFFAACVRLSADLLATPPFDLVAGRIAIDGLFLPLRGSAVVNIECSRTAANLARLRPTLFGTQCCLDGRTSRLWGGDEDRVRKLVAKALRQVGGHQIEDFDFLAVLINSTVYGGAGSTGPVDRRPRIAWATTGNTDSVEILLHELGHAFGLQDEYDTRFDAPVKP